MKELNVHLPRPLRPELLVFCSRMDGSKIFFLAEDIEEEELPLDKSINISFAGKI